MKNKELFLVVKRAIDQWNPYGLLPDAPQDEFDNESALIAAKLRAGDSADKIAEIISSVFSDAFEPQDFEKTSCMEVAEHIVQDFAQRFG